MGDMCREEVGGRGLREKERRLREVAATRNKEAQGVPEQMRAPWQEAKRLPSPKCAPPPSPRGYGGGYILHGGMK